MNTERDKLNAQVKALRSVFAIFVATAELVDTFGNPTADVARMKALCAAGISMLEEVDILTDDELRSRIIYVASDLVRINL